MPKKIAGSEARKDNLNMRTTKAMRARLETAAKESGRALAHEVEYRLEQSFSNEDVFFDMIAGRKNVRLSRSVVTLLRYVADFDEAMLHPDETLPDYDVDIQFAAGLVGLGQGISELLAKNLLEKADPDGPWRDAAKIALTRYKRMSPHLAEQLVLNPEDRGAVLEAKNFKPQSLKQLMGR